MCVSIDVSIDVSIALAALRGSQIIRGCSGAAAHHQTGLQKSPGTNVAKPFSGLAVFSNGGFAQNGLFLALFGHDFVTTVSGEVGSIASLWQCC